MQLIVKLTYYNMARQKLNISNLEVVVELRNSIVIGIVYNILRNIKINSIEII